MGGDKQGWGDGDSCDSSTHLSACVRMLRSLSRSGESPGGWGSWKGREGMVRAGTPQPHHTTSTLPTTHILPRLRGPNPELRPPSLSPSSTLWP